MLKDASRRKFDIVMAWAIDRLGRSLSDLLDTIQHLEACDVDLYLDQQAIDTTTPMGKLVFQLTGAFAEFERTMIRQRVKAGLKRAVAQGVKLGRPKIDRRGRGDCSSQSPRCRAICGDRRPSRRVRPAADAPCRVDAAAPGLRCRSRAPPVGGQRRPLGLPATGLAARGR